VVSCLRKVEPGFAVALVAGELLSIAISNTEADAGGAATGAGKQFFAKRQVIVPGRLKLVSPWLCTPKAVRTSASLTVQERSFCYGVTFWKLDFLRAPRCLLTLLRETVTAAVGFFLVLALCT